MGFLSLLSFVLVCLAIVEGFMRLRRDESFLSRTRIFHLRLSWGKWPEFRDTTVFAKTKVCYPRGATGLRWSLYHCSKPREAEKFLFLFIDLLVHHCFDVDF